VIPPYIIISLIYLWALPTILKIKIAKEKHKIFSLPPPIAEKRMAGDGTSNPYAHLKKTLQVGGQTFTYYNLKELGKKC
jgi:hypothetical protein